MKNVSLIFNILVSYSCIAYAQTVTIGTQVWMTKNLDVSTFRNGESIPEVKTAEEWEKAGKNQQPAWCYYNNDAANGAKYGKLYNWYAVNDPRGLAPVRYHIPSDAEWTVFSDYLGGESIAGGKMKSTGTQYWSDPNIAATNVSGFYGLPGGSRNSNGAFYGISESGYWWSSTKYSTDYTVYAWYRLLRYTNGDVVRECLKVKESGFSVRCLRD
jgi:uncharacterized protein (TIGR02145 family)